MRIAYLTVATIPSRTANSVHVMKMAQALKQVGHEVTLIAKAPTRATEIQAIQQVPKDLTQHYGITHSFPLATVVEPLLGREYGVGILQTIKALHLRPDLVWTRDIPTAFLSGRAGCRTLLELHSPEMGPVKQILFKNFLSMTACAGVCVITSALKHEILSRFADRVRSKPVVVAPDGVDLERFDVSLTAPDARKTANLPDQYTVGYVGHLYPGRGIEVILSLAERCPEIHFLVVGGNEVDVAKFQEIQKSRSLSNITFTGFVENSRVPLFLWCCDALLMPYQTKVAVSGGGDTGRWMSPMKLFEYMAAERPIIASDLTVLREVLDDKSALFCRPDAIDQWETAVKSLKENRQMANDLASATKRQISAFTWTARAEHVLRSISPGTLTARLLG